MEDIKEQTAQKTEDGSWEDADPWPDEEKIEWTKTWSREGFDHGKDAHGDTE